MTKIRKYWTAWLLTVCCLLLFIIPHTPIYAALTIDPELVTDWTAVAQNTVAESGVITCSSNFLTTLHIQAFLDSTTAHTGTEFFVLVSSKDAGDEDWHEFGGRKVALIGTANTEPITNNPLAATSTTCTVADTGGNYETAPMAHWIAIEDGTLVNSELVLQTAYVTDTSISWLDGTTNAHAQTTPLFDIADTWIVILPLGTNRAKLIINNTYDADGSTLNYKINDVEVTALN